MINKSELTAKQEVVARKMKAFFGKKTVVSHADLKRFMRKEYDTEFGPVFVLKNIAFKATDENGEIVRGMYKVPAVSAKPLSMTKDAIRKRALAAAKSGKTAVVKSPRGRLAGSVVWAPAVETPVTESPRGRLAGSVVWAPAVETPVTE